MTEPVSQQPESLKETKEASVGGFPMQWLAIAVGIAVLVLAAVVILQVAPTLIALLSPATPPFFDPAELIEYRPEDSRGDEWLYSSDTDGCDIYEWYAEQANACRVSPGSGCGGGDFYEHQSEFSVAYCTGEISFGDFTTHWEVFISDGYNTDGRSRFLIAREIDWD